MNLKEFAIDLVNAETEDQVVEILDKEGFWKAEEDYWQDIGDLPNNFGVIHAQSKYADRAIVEKLTNAIDSLLILECNKRGIDPESSDAPKSVRQASELFFNIPDGQLLNTTAKERKKIAEKIGLVATGTRKSPSYSIFDLGTGQSPNTMKNTILSIGQENKSRIQFVQGLYNQGGLGVLPFCSPNHHLQLILCKQHPSCTRPDDIKSEMWGITVLRREKPKCGERNFHYTYLAPGGSILTFNSPSLPILPLEHPHKVGRLMKHGTFIKLYEYQIQQKYRDFLNTTLHYNLSILLPDIALPIRLYERRDLKQKWYDYSLKGLTARLHENYKSVVEPDFPTHGTINFQGEQFLYSVFAFKKGANLSRYKNGQSIIFTLGGQNHGSELETIFQRKSLSYYKPIQKSILIMVDCSKLSNKARLEFFMATRDRMRDSKFYDGFLRRLTIEISRHQLLKMLRQKRWEEETEKFTQDNTSLDDLLRMLVSSEPELSELISPGKSSVNSSGKMKYGKDSLLYKGRKFPSYFELLQAYPRNKPKNYLTENKRFRVQFKTDVSNDYFNRKTDPGEHSLYVNGEPVDSYSVNLRNGYATLNIEETEKKHVDQILRYQSIVDDIDQTRPLINDFFVRVSDGGGSQKTSSHHKRKDATLPGNGNSKHLDSLMLPITRRISKHEWDDDNEFDSSSVLHIKDGGKDGSIFLINIDNIHLQNHLKRNREKAELDLRRYELYITFFALRYVLSAKISKGEPDPEKAACLALKYIAPMVLPLVKKVESLSNLKLV